MKNLFGQDTTALITGGSSGIGLALGRLLASRGANVWLLARDEKKLQNARDQVISCRRSPKQEILTLSLDLSCDDEVQARLDAFMHRHGVPDLLINCAGVAHPGEFLDMDPGIFRWMMEVNYFGTVNACRAVAPKMARRGEGRIVNVSSVAGFMGVYGYSAYGASKYAVRGFSDVLRAEMKSHGVQVSIVFPPDTDTPQLAYESQYKPAITRALAGEAQTLSADVVAEHILHGVERGQYVIIPGPEGPWLWRATNLLGSLFYPVMDWMINRARRRLGLPQHVPAQQDQTYPHQISEQQVHQLHPDRCQQQHVDHSKN